jgi:hypothetical protein
VFKKEISGELPSKAMLFSDTREYFWGTSKQSSALIVYHGSNGEQRTFILFQDSQVSATE